MHKSLERLSKMLEKIEKNFYPSSSVSRPQDSQAAVRDFLKEWRSWGPNEQQIKIYLFLHYASVVQFDGSAYQTNPQLATLVRGAMADDVFKLLPDSITALKLSGQIFQRSVQVDGTPAAQVWDREDLIRYFKRLFGPNWIAPTLRE